MIGDAGTASLPPLERIKTANGESGIANGRMIEIKIMIKIMIRIKIKIMG